MVSRVHCKVVRQVCEACYARWLPDVPGCVVKVRSERGVL